MAASRKEILETLTKDGAWRFWGPDGLGWDSPSKAATVYLRDPDSYNADRTAVDYLKAQAKAAELAADSAARTVPDRYDAGTKQLIDDILAAYDSGQTAEQIAASLGYIERGIRVVIRLRGRLPDDGIPTSDSLPEPVRNIINGAWPAGGSE